MTNLLAIWMSSVEHHLGEWMAVLAMGWSSLWMKSFVLFLAKDWLKVIRVTAGPTQACVMQLSVRHAFEEFIKHPVKLAVHPFPRHSSVPVDDTAGPYPAIVYVNYPFQNALWQHLEKLARFGGMTT
jgi:hypothetical protein